VAERIVDIYEAKDHLSRLIERVEEGVALSGPTRR
jgi:antitoxin (DNA-binding transcriptional repressor) of toxin-antitoxin stability system